MDLGTGGGGNGKKPLDAQINLVPFIDLMAVTIAFLVLTAAWTQVGRMEVSNTGTALGPPDDTPATPVTLRISETALTLTVGSEVMEPLKVERDAQQRLLLSPLREKLLTMRTSLPDQQNITLQADDTVRYDDLVRIVDTCIGAKLSAVAVSPTN